MLRNSVKQVINQIINMIEQLQDLPNTKRQYLYCELNIGKHIRHINDHFIALKNGINTGIIDYNCRSRGTEIETNDVIAVSQIKELLKWVEEYNFDESNGIIKVLSEIDCLQTQSLEFQSNIAREFLYLINHTIHHAAHIGLIATAQGIEIPLNTGLAPSTLSFMRDNI